MLAAGAAGLLTACGSGTPTPAPTETVTNTAAPAPASPGDTPAVPAASTGPCRHGANRYGRAADLPAVGPAGHPSARARALAGTFYRVLVLTNISGSDCYPVRVSRRLFRDRAGRHVIGAPARRNPLIPDTLITLPPGRPASALTGVTDTGALPAAGCKPGRG